MEEKKAAERDVEQVMKNPDLTDKQRLFCIYYSRCFNATKAYQKAYECDYFTAKAHGFELLQSVAVKAEILRLKQSRLNRELLDVIPTLPPVTEEDAKDKEPKEIKHLLKERAAKAYEEKEAQFPEAEHLREVERVFLLRVIDAKWMDHIDDMDQLRQGIGLQAYGQRDPLVEYKMIGYDMFGEMTRAIEVDTVRLLFHVNVEQKVEREQVAKVTGTNKDDSVAKGPKVRAEKKIYPNDPCPCGSGKKYKQCCGRK